MFLLTALKRELVLEVSRLMNKWMHFFYQPGRSAEVFLHASIILVSCQQPLNASMADELHE